MAQAQGFSINSFFRSSCQQLIEDAVQDGLYIVESSYLLEDSTGQRFGLDGKPYFNRMRYAGFAMNGGDIIPSEAFRPWLGDAEFAPYKETYKPVLYGVNLRAKNDTAFHSIESLAFKDTVQLWDGYIVARKKEIKGFEPDTTIGEKDGWLVLLGSDDADIRCMQKSIEVTEAGKQTVEVPSELSALIGGVYVVPVVEKVGQITFQLCGVVLPSQGGKQLTICHPFVGKNYSKELNPASKGGKLQPINTSANTKAEKQKDIKKSCKKKK